MDEYHESGAIHESARMISDERRCYIEYLRRVHDEVGFRTALLDEMRASAEDVERLLFEAEMLANYGVA